MIEPRGNAGIPRKRGLKPKAPRFPLAQGPGPGNGWANKFEFLGFAMELWEGHVWHLLKTCCSQSLSKFQLEPYEAQSGPPPLGSSSGPVPNAVTRCRPLPHHTWTWAQSLGPKQNESGTGARPDKEQAGTGPRLGPGPPALHLHPSLAPGPFRLGIHSARKAGNEGFVSQRRSTTS